jgi:DNA helicase-2/ATP-dependent DNA helicase PcrA
LTALPPIVQEELGLLDKVQTLLAQTPFDLPPSEQDTVTELVRIRDEIQSAKDEDKAALMQQYEHHYALLSQMRATRDRPQVDPASPYFAHLRLEETSPRGEVRRRDLFLGKATRIDGGLRIVDWRNAPISRVFYTCQQGDDFEEELADRTVEGKLLVRRTVTIRRGNLERVDAPEGRFALTEGGEWTVRTVDRPRMMGGQQSSATHLHSVRAAGTASARRLGTDTSGQTQRADKHLPDIAGLIDPEQFDLITRPSGGFLVIRGTAGSGKTTVALHRIAWLAFNDPKIDSRDTLFLVFSRALRDYVSRVLPGLGIHRVLPLTFPDWARDQRMRHLPKLPKRLRDDTPEIVNRLKLHPATMVALERYIQGSEHPATAEQVIDDWSTVLTEISVLGPVIRELAADAFSEDELARAVSWCRDRHEELLAWLDREPESTGELDAEDDALLLRAWQLRVGPLRRADGFGNIRYRHVCIDEVQDFSPIEVRVLLDCLDDDKSITLSGDTQQHVMAHAGFTSWANFFSWLGVQGTAVETLKVAYRSSRPIVQLALGVLGDLREDGEPPMVVREGPPVEVFPFTDHGAVVAFLADTLRQLVHEEPLANVALITPNQSLAETYEAGLRAADVPRLRRVVDEGFSFQPGVEIVEVSDVKGLEFDYVVILEASANNYPDTPNSRRQLHVAATRAIHQLWVTSVGPLSPVLKAALGEAQGDTA